MIIYRGCCTNCCRAPEEALVQPHCVRRRRVRQERHAACGRRARRAGALGRDQSELAQHIRAQHLRRQRAAAREEQQLRARALSAAQRLPVGRALALLRRSS